MNGKFIFWIFHQAHWSHCTRDSEKHSGSVILWDLTEAPPTPNEDIISEGVKGCVKCTLWLAGCQKDLHDWTRCFWRILYDPGMIYIPGLGSGFRDLMIVAKKESIHIQEESVMARTYECLNSKFLPWFTLVSKPSNSNMWYLSRNPRSILEYVIVTPG